MVTEWQNRMWTWKENTLKRDYKAGKKTPNCKQKFIFQDLSRKTVVALRCRGAHRDCMRLMHRITWDFSIGWDRELGRVCLLLVLLFFIPVIVLFFLVTVAVKELVEMLLEITWFGHFSGLFHLLCEYLFMSPSSLHHCSSEGLSFKHAGPANWVGTRKRKID